MAKNSHPDSNEANDYNYFLDYLSEKLKCPICFDICEEAQVTECGHSFCLSCITQALGIKKRCPICNTETDKFFAKTMVNGHTSKRRKIDPIKKEISNPDYKLLNGILQKKKSECLKTPVALQNELLKTFLKKVRHRKLIELVSLVNALKVVEDRIAEYENREENVPHSTTEYENREENVPDSTTEIDEPVSSSGCQIIEADSEANYLPQESVMEEEHAELTKHAFHEPPNPNPFDRLEKVKQNHEHLGQFYLDSLRNPPPNDFEASSSDSYDQYESFEQILFKTTSFIDVKSLGTVYYPEDPIHSPAIVAAIQFDKDDEIFAAGGVLKDVKLFDYSTVIKSCLSVNYPVTCLECDDKISNLSWSPYYKSSLATSDYSGFVTVWDVCTQKKIKSVHEHIKRCWSVDFNKLDTNLLISGGDDFTAKLWALNCDSSLATLHIPAHVTSVAFNPSSKYHFAIGSSNNQVYYYDLRNTDEPVAVSADHSQPVGSLKFLSSKVIVSTSLSSELKTWDHTWKQCQRTFSGHRHKRKFIGLDTQGQYISCGSEDNSLYFYYKGFSKPILVYSFDSCQVTNLSNAEEKANQHFVSSICWKTGENVLLASNSQGFIRILEVQ